ncbi:hypothetical protein [Nocardioides antri]|uniref:Uncharacterized protein n=1 Tax=Nocardioides antri TaxID=2607659 RepID=A0A5B1M3D4_9ACTN|nr:hypothetical protein [Nocardioides antri]KAA1427725.1 hypothetical protein F0U47_09825 [Nocardioides antri]
MSQTPEDEQRIAGRSDLLPEEEQAGSEDREAQAEAILEESDERVDDPEGTRRESTQTPGPSDDAAVSEVGRMDPADADTPIADGDAAASYPTSESGEAQEPEPEAGPNANPHRDEDTR